MQSRMRRLQLRGSGGFSPRFPSIAPAELRFYGLVRQLQTACLPLVARSMQRTGRIAR